MQRSRRSVLASGSGMIAAVGLAGCLSGDDDNGDDDNGDDENGDDPNGDDDNGEGSNGNGDEAPDAFEASEFEVLDRDHDEEVTVYLHGDHWHGDPLEVPYGDNLSLGAHVENEDGDHVHFDDGVEFEGAVLDGAQEIVSFDGHGDHVHLHGDEEGLTDVVFMVTADGEVLYETPALEVDVGDHDHDHEHDHGEVDELRIFDRAPDPHEEVAEIHGDHWHGELPHVHVGDNLSLGAEFEDEDGHEIPIGHDEEYELAVRVADDAEEDVVSIDPDDDYHGDHVHVHGESEGETELVFMLWHDDHADWESPPIAVEVEDH